MNCPYCQSPLAPDSPACPACQLTFPRANALLGAMPLMHPGLSDTPGLISAKEKPRLRDRIQELRRRFPQVSLQIVLHRFPEAHPFSLYAFWIFNGSALGSHSNRGAANRAILLLIDPARGESALAPGYGLEPFLPQPALDHLLELASPAWAAGQWAKGIHTVLDGLDPLLESTASVIEQPANPDEGF